MLKQIFISLISFIFLYACAERPVIPQGGNLSAMPVISDPSYYDNTNTYFDRDDQPVARRIEPLLEEAVSNGLPGGIILIDTPASGTWVCSKGKIDLKNNIPMKKNSMSRIASITKMFVSVLTLKLAEEGKLALDDPISNYLPSDLIRSIKNTDRISIRQLLNHSSGIIENYDPPEILYQAGRNDDTSKKIIRTMRNYFQPGEKSYYSDSGFILLGEIIEGLEKKPIAEIFRERIFIPLGMKSTYYDPDNPVHKETARGYSDFNNNGNYCDATDFDWARRNSAGGIVSCVYDMAFFIKALFNSRSFLSEKSLSEMTNNMRLETHNYVDYGLGIMRLQFFNGAFMYGHSGGQLSYTAELYYFPAKKLTVACLFNSSIRVGKSSRLISDLWWVKILDILAYDELGKAVLKKTTAEKVASIRDSLPSYDDQIKPRKELESYLKAQRIVSTAPGFTIYHGNAGKLVDMEVVQPVAELGTNSARVKFKEMEPCDTASILQKGSYTKTPLSYDALYRWIKENNYEAAGPSREYYYRGDWNEKDPNEYLMEIRIPVKKK